MRILPSIPAVISYRKTYKRGKHIDIRPAFFCSYLNDVTKYACSFIETDRLMSRAQQTLIGSGLLSGEHTKRVISS